MNTFHFPKINLIFTGKNGNFSILHKLLNIVVMFFMQNNTFSDKINVENFSFFRKILIYKYESNKVAKMTLILLRDLKLSFYELLYTRGIWEVLSMAS